MRSIAGIILCLPLLAAEVWTLRLEEPTGIDRRAHEVVAVPLGACPAEAPFGIEVYGPG
jgi:hypothetical protein